MTLSTSPEFSHARAFANDCYRKGIFLCISSKGLALMTIAVAYKARKADFPKAVSVLTSISIESGFVN